MSQILPGILEKDFLAIENKLQIIKPFSKRVHIDFLDGKFSPEISLMEISSFSKYKEDFFMEAHLMVDDPLQYLKPLADAGFNRFLGHIEKMKDLDEFIAKGQILGEIGIALDIDTNIDSIEIPFDDLDVILLMAVKAGKSGQEFNLEVLEKIKKIREKSEITIEIDGGINRETLVKVKEQGANRFVATSFIFSDKDPMLAYEILLGLAG